MVRHASLSGYHEDAVFGLVIGTLAVLVAVIVFSVYGAARDASDRRHHRDVPAISIVKPQ